MPIKSEVNKTDNYTENIFVDDKSVIHISATVSDAEFSQDTINIVFSEIASYTAHKTEIRTAIKTAIDNIYALQDRKRQEG